jgi:hypothetical protein
VATETFEAGTAAETATGIGIGTGAAAIAAGLLVLLWPASTAPPWADEINPITGAPYRDQQEYDQFKKLSPDEIARLRAQNASGQLSTAKTDADTVGDAPVSSATQSCQAEPQPQAISPVQPAVTPQTQRKYPDQTCEDERREELQTQKNAACNVPRSCKDQSLGCDEILQRIEQNKACLAARQQMRDECFGGAGDQVHDQQIQDVQDVLDRCIQRAKEDDCL